MKLRAVELRYQRLLRSQLSDAESTEVAQVDALAMRLQEHLRRSSAAIDTVHVHGASSSRVQEIVSSLLCDELGFREEQVLTAEIGLSNRPRPDFIHRLAPGRGVLAEVERGGTITNNHDLKDFWKTHIAPDAHHLFLVVPMTNWTEAGGSRGRVFMDTSRRLGAFFGDPRREVDVLSTHIFGYGRTP